MRAVIFLTALVFIAFNAPGAERKFAFTEEEVGKTPAGFHSALLGGGPPAKWEVVMDEVPPELAPINPEAALVYRRPALAQLSEDMTDERFPLLIFEEEEFRDFTFTARVKLVKGVIDHMAGLIFRVQDENNFYVVRVSGSGNNFRFYKVVNGLRGEIIGPSVPIERDRWYEISVECQGNRIRCFLDGKPLIPELTDSSFTKGRIGFWTKSDSVSYFSDARISYTPVVPRAQVLVDAALKKYSRLRGMKVFARKPGEQKIRLIAGDDPQELGMAGSEVDAEVIDHARVHVLKTRENAVVTMPVRDRNGEPIASVRVIMKSFPGQTDRNAVARATPAVKLLNDRIQYAGDLYD